MGSPQVIILDTHTWVWWVSNPEKLSAPARERIDKAVINKNIFISSISAWEIAMLTARGRLKLTMDARDWIAKSESLPFLRFIPVTNQIALKSVHLPGKLHSDPADRIIVATALIQETTIITADEKILDYPHVETLW